MPKPRRKNQNKSLPKHLQAGVEGFAYWGCKFNQAFPDRPTSPSPTHLTVGDLSQSEADPLTFIACSGVSSTDEISQDGLDELPSYADNSQASSSSNSYHPSRQRSKRGGHNTSRSTANDLPFRQSRQSPRRRESRKPRRRTRGPADDSEASRTSPSNTSSLSSARLPTSLQSGLIIESADRDRDTSAGQEFRLSSRENKHQMSASFSRSPERMISLEPSPILPPAGTTGSSQTPFPLHHPASNTGTQIGTFLPRMDPFSSGDVAQANPAAGYYSSFSITEPPISPSQDFNGVSTSTYPPCPFPCMYPSPASSSSLSSMAQPGYYNQSFSRSLNEDIMNDSTVGGNSYSYYPSSDNCLPPASSMNPQIYSGMPMNTPGGTHLTYSASSRSHSHVGSPSLQITSSSSQLVQTTQGYVSNFGVNANVQDHFFLPETNYRSLPRSYDFQAQSHGLSQDRVYGRSQFPRDIATGVSPTYASNNHPPNAIQTSSVSNLGQDRGYQRLKSSLSAPLTDSNL